MMRRLPGEHWALHLPYFIALLIYVLCAHVLTPHSAFFVMSHTREAARIEVLKRLPNILKIDGDMVKPAEREQAMGAVE